jgi:hypothetical protein
MHREQTERIVVERHVSRVGKAGFGHWPGVEEKRGQSIQLILGGSPRTVRASASPCHCAFVAKEVMLRPVDRAVGDVGMEISWRQADGKRTTRASVRGL